ncbi:hypothetical protein [Granulicoccus phenolivorans]|uniref:hypothetical protein n=1 Tax=Granulicoccus phenolivorans TaxID=266854 RepID=UPI0003FE517E|nr:hypothetical protein [Granulicoccus phenolivorans]
MPRPAHLARLTAALAVALPLALAGNLAAQAAETEPARTWSGPRLAEAGQGRCAPAYTLEEVTGLGGNATYVTALNNSGDVAGSSRTGTTGRPQLPFHQDQRLEVPAGSTFGRVMDLNERGQAAGEVFTAAPEQSRAALWSTSGQLTILESPGRPGGVANAINSRGQVAGVTTATDGRARATVWDNKGSAKTLPFYQDEAGASARALDLADDGTAVGSSTFFEGEGDDRHGHGQAALWTSQGAVHTLGALADHGTSSAKAVTGAYVVGEASLSGATRAVAFTDHGPQELPTLNDWRHSTANEVSQQGVVVGHSSRLAGAPTFGGAATVWCEGRAVDLGSVTVGAPEGWTLISAEGINPRGQIAGYARTTDGAIHGFVLTPGR